VTPPVRSEVKRKMRAMRTGINQGWAEGALLGRIPLLSPIAGAVKGWIRTTITLFREDLAS